MTEENKINFWEINLNNEQKTDSENFLKNKKLEQEKSIIAKANEEKNKPFENTINLDDIKIKEEKKENQKKIEFGTDWTEKREKKHYHINYRKIFILSFITILITSIVSWALYIYNDYIENYSTNTEIEETKISESIWKIKNLINKYFKKEHNANNEIIISGKLWITELTNVVESDKNYIQKKEILKDSVKNLVNTILINYKTLDNNKKAITKNGFFSNEISEIIWDKEQIWSIQNSLLSLEAIKFNSAINVFSYLDTFLESLSKSLEKPKSVVQENTEDIISRWDKDINLYITNCYLNPYETSHKCNIIWDFDRYYKITKDAYFDTNFFKELIHYTDIKLEQTELPSFSITFKEFNQNKDEITFNIDINTFKQDEVELAKKWILSPHIFIFTNLINNLKQSKFILWEWISTKSLNIETKILDIGSTQFIVNNSNKSFTLPIQKESQREIFDFMDTIE